MYNKDLDSIKKVLNRILKDENLKRSLLFATTFYIYIVLFDLIIWFLLLKFNLNIYYTKIILFIALFSWVIAIITQLLHFLAELPNEGNLSDFLYNYFWYDCFPRCFSGFLEMIFYVTMLLLNAGYLIAGYLIVKVLSVWKSEKQIIEGRHTSVLRIAITLSLLFSFLVFFIIKK